MSILKMHITPYHLQKRVKNIVVFCLTIGSPIYRYEILPMGITCAPQIWMDYITLILGELQHKAKYIAIMDDLRCTQHKGRTLVVDRTTFTFYGEEWAQT